MAGIIRVGISGWTYDGWRGAFYPPDLPQAGELGYATRRLSSLEINGTFYSLQSPKSYSSWAAQAPDDFVFSVKAPRFITHVKRLKNVKTALANFFANGLFRLGDKLGPILWQLPPSLRFDPGLLRDFLALLPRDTRAAAALARGHDDAVAERCELEPGPDRPLRHALEVRHASFRDPRFVPILRRAGVALVAADTAGKWPYFDESTSDFAYARLHGDKVLYASGYTPKALRSWAAKVRAWSRSGRDVFVYFDNDAKGRAPFDAMSLSRLLGAGPLTGARRAAPPSGGRRASAAGPRRRGSSGSPSARARRAARS